MRAAVLAAVALLLAAGALSGCFGATSDPVRVVPYLPLNDAQPERPTEFAFLVRSTSAFKQVLPVTARGLPEGWTFEPEAAEVTVNGGAGTSLVVRLTPDANATYGPHDVRVAVGDAEARVVVNVKDLGREPARAGVGAQVHYVLWYANGTLAATNDRAALDQADLGRPVLHDPNATADTSPLKVYVGGQRGTPPPEPYNSTGCDQAPCYHPVIPGFDARLRDAGDGRGMVAGETLAVRVPKERAYTYPGNEDHPLYGEDLSFLVRVVSVDVLPVRACELPVCPPT